MPTPASNRNTDAPNDPATSFDPIAALDLLLADVGLGAGSAGGSISFAGQDPILRSRHRLGACIGIPMMAAAVSAAAFGRQRGAEGQDLHLDLRQAVHGINPDLTWHPTLNGEPPPHSLVFDNPFLLAPFTSRDGRTMMASGVYPHLAAKWCRFLNVPPDFERAAAAFARWDAFDLEERANEFGLPLCVARTPGEWLAHEQGALLATQPVIRLRRIGDAEPRDRTVGHVPATPALAGIRVLSFTHAIAGPVVGRTLAEQGADVLCVTRPNDFEHDFIYFHANTGSRSTYADVTTEAGRARAHRLLTGADVVVNNHRGNKLEELGLEPSMLAERYPGIVAVSITCYGSKGPWARRGGFDMNGSAASGLMAIEGSRSEPRLPVTGMINDFITGYLGAAGAAAGLLHQANEGGSWHVTVSLTRTAMWYQTLGLVDPSNAGSSDARSPREPAAVDAATPLGAVHTLAPPVRFSRTAPRWRDPILVPRGSSAPEWL